MVKKVIFSASFAIGALVLCGQQVKQDQFYTHQDSLRGSITPERAWWDLLHYDLFVAVNPKDETISGKNIIKYQVLSERREMQIDLQVPLVITGATQNQKELSIRHDGDAHFITLLDPQIIGNQYTLEINYEGRPHVAINPPWEGGFIWSLDKNGKDFIATSCQGIGASTWWPCKEHTYDEPDDGMILRFNCPEKLVAVGNGRLIREEKGKHYTKTYTWEVMNPINNYGVSLNIGDYVNFSDSFPGERGLLNLDYWVLKGNLKKARNHFKEVDQTLTAFEYWFGPYPFYEDSYKLVEVPYTGMEHQSGIAYGNGYKDGYSGVDRSQTGWGDSWDYIIVHETAHEWFGNNITYRDPADMWIHESFSAYAEGLFVEYFDGKEAGSAYLRGLRPYIDNRAPIIGDYGVNDRGEDIYDKGANMLHTIRQLVDNDSLWREILRGMNREFYHEVVTTDQVEQFMADQSGLDLSTIFDQYLRDFRIPVLEYMIVDNTLSYRWTNCIEGFDMPVSVFVGEQSLILRPETAWSRIMWPSQIDMITINDDFYVYSKKLHIDKLPRD